MSTATSPLRQRFNRISSTEEVKDETEPLTTTTITSSSGKAIGVAVTASGKHEKHHVLDVNSLREEAPVALVDEENGGGHNNGNSNNGGDDDGKGKKGSNRSVGFFNDPVSYISGSTPQHALGANGSSRSAILQTGGAELLFHELVLTATYLGKGEQWWWWW